MTFDHGRVGAALRAFDFTTLFLEELGWDHYDTPLDVYIGEQQYRLQAVAEKRGMVALVHTADDVPDHGDRRKIELRAAKLFREHLIIYADTAQSEQVWQWVRREIGRPLASREHRFQPAYHSGESLVQKLQHIAFSIEQEEDLRLTEVVGGARAAFNVERATRRFFDYFKKERDAFEKFVQGIDELGDKRWYVSVMLNRLMFIYFIQKKGFLDGDPDYLRNRMRLTRERFGDDQFYSFYRYFLLRLFHEGLGQPERDAKLEQLVGKVPYLNGGIFEQNRVEREYPNLDISDAAFERILNFFDRYQWHLDDRPLRDDNEINPDVLGYIFEKYVNQKQMGAYYTKEDITDYISKNTIIPYLFDAARKQVPIAFEGDPAVWDLLPADPDRYIYPAMQKGVELELPPEIAAGIDDVDKRGMWNTRTPEEYALPTEIWRETVARRQRCAEVRAKLAAGEVRAINDLITYNLDIRQFAQDVVENVEGPETLRAFWKALNAVSVLDPTCGSGAFLFAALNILEPLYAACLNRMRGFVEELGPDYRGKKYSDFRAVLEQIERHPNEQYFILKSIVVNNLYGVDIMSEAVEIAKLRLFLKLVAQVDSVDEIEPLPDVDFNLRAGNTLVGFATREQVAKAFTEQRVAADTVQSRMLMPDEADDLARIEEKAADVDRLYQEFRALQTQHDMAEYAEDFAETKRALRERLDALNEELNRALARQYGVDPSKPKAYQKWLDSHLPFHWFVEFYGIMSAGGFDVIIGNPPYIEYHRIRREYQLLDDNFKTLSCGNLYAFVIEICHDLMRDKSTLGMIVQLSAICTDRMMPLQSLYLNESESVWASCFDDRPAKLFDGLEHIRATVILSIKGRPQIESDVYTTRLIRWYSECRPALFEQMTFALASKVKTIGSFPKLGDEAIASIIAKLTTSSDTLMSVYRENSEEYVNYHRSPLYWIRAMNFVPHFSSPYSDRTRSHHHFKEYGVSHSIQIPIIGCIINSSLFYVWFIVYGNGRNVTLRDIHTMPSTKTLFTPHSKVEFSELFAKLMSDYIGNSVQRQRRDGVEYQEFYPSKSKSIMDEIDRALSERYGLDSEALDLIINYDIKYRMGAALFAEDEHK